MSGGGAQGQQGGSGTSDQMVNLVVIVVTIFGGLLLIWLLKPTLIQIPVFLLRKYELIFANTFLSMLATLLQMIGLSSLKGSIESYQYGLKQLLVYIGSANYVNMSFTEFAAINNSVATFIRYPLSVVGLVLGLLCLSRARSRGFKKTYTVNDLKQVSTDNWPQIKPVQNINLVKQDIDKGVWAMAQTPFHYAKQYELLQATEIGDYKVWHLDEVAAYHHLSLQLGAPWKGLLSLPIHAQAVAVIFLSKLDGDKERSDTLISQIASSSSHGRLNFTRVTEYARQYSSHKILSWLSIRHAYNYTLLSRLLELTRGTGVMATSELLWLKAVDRRLWYILNSTGRQTAVVEVAGAVSHFLAEKKMNHAIHTPMIKQSVEALKLSLNEILREEEDEQWSTNAV